MVELGSAVSEVARGGNIFRGEVTVPFQVIRRTPGLPEADIGTQPITSGGRHRRPWWYFLLCCPFFCVYVMVAILVDGFLKVKESIVRMFRG